MTAGAACRFIVHFSTSFFTTNCHAAIPKCRSRRLRGAHQAFAGFNPKSGAIFTASSTSNNVAVLRTLPEMVMSAWEMRGAVRTANQDDRSRCRVVELRSESHSDALGGHSFPESLRKKNFRWADLVQETWKRVRGSMSNSLVDAANRKSSRGGNAFILGTASGPGVNIPSPRHRSTTTPQRQSIWLTYVTSLIGGVGLALWSSHFLATYHDKSG